MRSGGEPQKRLAAAPIVRNPDTVIAVVQQQSGHCYLQWPAKILKEIDTIVVVDDVITTGGHFVAMRTKINQLYPHIKVKGAFLAHKIRNLTPN